MAERETPPHFIHMDSNCRNQYQKAFNSGCYDEIYNDMLKVTIEALNCSLPDDAPFIVAEYGTFDGKNLVKKLPLMKEKILRKYGKEREISVLLEDISYEPMKQIWEKHSEFDKVTFLTSAVSFYQQCFPSNTVHLGQICLATHYLNDVHFKMDDSIFPNVPSDKSLTEEIAQVAEKNWELFLYNRAKELAKGGVLLCVSLGYFPGIYEKLRWQPLNKAWNELFHQGFITQEEKRAGIIQKIIRTKEEHTKPFDNQQSIVYRAGLRLVQFQSCCLNSFKHLLHSTTENKDLQMVFADKYREFYKCIYHSHLLKALDKSRSKQEREGIMEKYFDLVKMEFLGIPNLSHVETNFCLHILVIRKE